jgi:DNA polymerase-1
VLMKYACSMWQKILKRLGIKYRLLNWVHDEFVTECLPEDAALVSKVQNWSIAKAGKMFKLHCPMGGESKIGHNWLEVH